MDPQPGEPLATTLDRRLQTLAERVLSDVRPASALVAIRPSTGDLLAVASGAGGGGLSTATVGRYAPGSTFKVVTSLALLRNSVEPTSVLYCPRSLVVDGKKFKNYDDYPAGGIGRIPLSTAVANSCNTAFIGERETVDQAGPRRRRGLARPRRRPRPRLPGLLRVGPGDRCRGRLRDRARRLADRAGPGHRLADGDGRRRRVGRQGLRRGPEAAARPARRRHRPGQAADRDGGGDSCAG